MSMSEEKLNQINFSLSNIPQKKIDEAVTFVTAEIDKEASQPYVISFEKGNIYASEEATVWFRKSFFLTDYVERYKLTDIYVNNNTIAVLAEYTVDYNEDQVPYDDGKTTKAYYLMINDESQEWII